VCTVSTDTLLTGSGFAWCEGDKTSIKQVLISDLKKEDIGNNSWTMFFILGGNKVLSTSGNKMTDPLQTNSEGLDMSSFAPFVAPGLISIPPSHWHELNAICPKTIR
jgi:hypothetical protein